MQASVSYTLGDGVEHLTLVPGAGAIDGTGNDLDNTITGNESANILSGGNGDDVLSGGLAQDTLTGGADADTFVMTDLTIADLIADYDIGEGDAFDLSALFEVDTDMSTATTDDDSLDQFVRIVDNGAGNNDELQIDANGGGDNFNQTVALFDSGAVSDIVRIAFNDDGATNTSDLAVV